MSDDFCASQNVTYHHRVFDTEDAIWCPVPGGGADALLFGALAVFVGCALYSRLSAVWALLAGAAFASLSWAVNLNHFSNALTVWLGMHPTFLFFQIFLPPLLLDSAVRLDFFLCKKLAAHSLLFAVVNVVLSTLAFIPVMLYGPSLQLSQSGWSVIDAALMGAMLGSTDAVAVSAILKAGGAPEMLSVLLECESLFNDASSILLFEVFLKGSLEGRSGPDLDIWSILPGLLQHVGYLFVAGAVCGLLMGLLTKLFFKLLHKRHVPPYVEVAAVLAGAYTVYLCTEFYAYGSGVIAVVVYGLYGASTYQYGLSSKGLRTGAFIKFFDALAFCLNGMVFFYVGSSIVNFFLSLSGDILSAGDLSDILQGLPIILAAMFVLRGGLIYLEAPLLSLVGPRMSWQEVLFSTIGGLRGGLALILVQTVLAAHTSTPDLRLKVVHAQMALWVSGVVLFTLTANAAALGPLMVALGLNKTTPLQRKMHRGAYAALSQYTAQTISDLRCDDDEMLKGVDWRAVEQTADVQPEAQKGSKPSSPTAKLSDRQAATTLHRRAGRSLRTTLSGALTPPILSHSPRSSIDLTATPADIAAAATAAAAGGAAAGAGEPVSRSRKSFRASSRLAASSGSMSGGVGGGLTVPLLSRIVSGRERYAPDAGSDDEDIGGEPDIESGNARESQNITPSNNSEAYFIASRLQQQDQQLAEHTAAATNCPLLKLSTGSDSTAAAAADADADAAADGEEGEATVDQSADVADSVDGGSEAGGAESQASPVAAATAAVAPEVAGAGAALQLQTLQPLIPVCVTDMLAAAATIPRWQQSTLPNLTAADEARAVEASAAAAAVAATAAAMAPQARSPGAVLGSRSSFIAAANGAMSAAGVLGVRTASKPLQVQEGPHPHNDTMSDLSDEEGVTQDQYLEECRMSLLAGLKRHFRFKAAEGLLSKNSLRTLEYACDTALSRPGQPLSMWKECGTTHKQLSFLSAVAGLHLQLRRYQAALLRQKGGCAPLRQLLIAVLHRCSHQSRRYLGKVAVTALEVALELWLALTVSPVAKLMRHSHTPASALLQEELSSQAAAVWRFIMDRQLEAPDEFAALQTHRVKLAVARRQLAFVERMAQVGAVDEQVGEELQELLERRLHRLERLGPNWQNPGIIDALRRLPFLTCAPESLLLWLRAYGELRSYQPGQCIIPRGRSSPPGVFIVLLGLVRVEVKWPGTQQESHFVGVGGSVGILPSVIGRDLPGAGLVAAYGMGNALGRGPLVLHLPMRLLSTIRQRAAPAIQAANSSSGSSSSSGGKPVLDIRSSGVTAAGLRGSIDPQDASGRQAAVGGDALSSAVFAQLLLDMHRHVGVMLLDRMGAGETNCFTQHLEAATKAVFKHVGQLPPHKATTKLQRLMQPLLATGTTSAAPSELEVAELLAAALDRQYSGSLAANAAAGPEAADGAAAAAGAGGVGHTTAPLDGDLLELLRSSAVAAGVKLRDAMRGASLVTLTAGQTFSQTSTILLLNGALRLHSSADSASSSTSDKPTNSPSRRGLFRGRSQRSEAGSAGSLSMTVGQHGMGAMRQFTAPALLAWGPEVFDTLEDRYDSKPQHATAGPAGALLLVTCYRGTAEGASSAGRSPDGVAGASVSAAAGPSSGQAQQQQQTRGYTCVSSLQQLERTVAPAVQPDVEDV